VYKQHKVSVKTTIRGVGEGRRYESGQTNGSFRAVSV
tara:strand:+ start:816 stop:926 length:111 start_codon:yes stop_codon:yes gene_type:complete